MTNTLVPASLARANRSFTREDLLKWENRVNVELFGAHSILEFWEPLCDLLEIPRGAWLTREVVDGTSNRPDFILNGVAGTGAASRSNLAYWIRADRGATARVITLSSVSSEYGVACANTRVWRNWLSWQARLPRGYKIRTALRWQCSKLSR